MNTCRFVLCCALLAVMFFVSACATVPITGRKQLSLIPDAEMNALSFQQYDQVIAESQLSTDAEATDEPPSQSPQTT